MENVGKRKIFFVFYHECSQTGTNLQRKTARKTATADEPNNQTENDRMNKRPQDPRHK